MDNVRTSDPTSAILDKGDGIRTQLITKYARWGRTHKQGAGNPAMWGHFESKQRRFEFEDDAYATI